MKKPCDASNNSAIVDRQVSSPARRRGCRWLAPILVVVGALLFSPRSTGESRLHVDDPVWDLGTVPDGMDVAHAFVVRNAGDTDLHLREIRSSCSSCLTAFAEATVIAPGGSGFVWCRFDPRSRQGLVAQEIRIESNDPRKSVCYLKVQGVVEPLFELPEIPFRIGPTPATSEVKLPIRRLRASASSALRVRSKPDFVEASVAPVDRFLSVLTIRGVAPFPSGRHPIRIELGAEDPSDPGCLVTGEWHNPDPLEISPDELRFAPVPGAQRRIVWIRQDTLTPMGLVGVRGPSDAFRSEVRSGARRGEYRLHLTGTDVQDLPVESFAIELRFLDSKGIEHVRRVPVVLEQPASPPDTAAGMELAYSPREESATTP